MYVLDECVHMHVHVCICACTLCIYICACCVCLLFNQKVCESLLPLLRVQQDLTEELRRLLLHLAPPPRSAADRYTPLVPLQYKILNSRADDRFEEVRFNGHQVSVKNTLIIVCCISMSSNRHMHYCYNLCSVERVKK